MIVTTRGWVSAGMLGLISVAACGQPFGTVINIGTGQADGTSLPSRSVIESDTQLNIFEGGSVGQFLTVGSVGGTGYNTELNMFAGSIGDNMWIESGAVANIYGGTIGDFGLAFTGGRLNIFGGEIGERFTALAGSHVLIAGGSFGTPGGSFGTNFTARGGSVVEMSGGNAGIFEARFGSTVTITGGELLSLRAGVNGSADGPGEGMIVIGGDAEIGLIESELPSMFSISGGLFRDTTSFRGVTNISGGLFEYRASVRGEADITGGVFEQGVRVRSDAVADISGGLLGEGFQADAGAVVNFFGTEFALNGVPISIEIGETLTITQRAAYLTGLLADGSGLDLGLRLTAQPGLDSFSRDATLTITRVVPGAGTLGVLGVGLLGGMRRRR